MAERLIDANKLKKRRVFTVDGVFTMGATEEDIDNAPVIEAIPVRHGHWIDIDSETYTWAIRCNKCGHERSMMSTQKTYPNYCEKCGAKMDERKEE